MRPATILTVLIQAVLCVVVCTEKAPVILVPGLGGSVLEEKLNRTSSPAFYCTEHSDWQVIWLSLTSASRPDCFLDELNVFYNQTTDRYYNQTGVEIRPYQFGNLSGIAALDPSLSSVSGTYEKLISGLIDAGYEEGHDLFGAPYDFRLAADGLEQTGVFASFKTLIEEAVFKNEGRPAVLIAHSMGSLVCTYFISHQDAAWVKKHLSSFYPISAPWEGAVTALKGSISGDNFDVSFIPHDLLRPLQSRAPSGPWLFPSAEIWGDEVLVSTRKDNYTAGDALKLLQDLNLTQQAAVYNRVHKLTLPLPELHLPVHCMYGTGVETETGFYYDVDHFNASVDPPAPNKTRSGDGDGTVNLRSLEACTRLGKDVKLQSFEGASHLGLLEDDRIVKVIVDLLGKGQADDRRPGAFQRWLDWVKSWWSSDKKQLEDGTDKTGGDQSSKGMDRFSVLQNPQWSAGEVRERPTDRNDGITLHHGQLASH